MPKRYNLHGWAGLVAQHRNRASGTLIGIYHAAQAGLDDDPALPWATVCEEHSTLVLHPTLRLARYHAAVPMWCEYCQAVILAKENNHVRE